MQQEPANFRFGDFLGRLLMKMGRMVTERADALARKGITVAKPVEVVATTPSGELDFG